ncbi:hypothetical protein [Streptomyces iconiensis]|uniref:Uncharacterized protein n=1 Tax=Streptomyces iconiensis TaxID=1384038 RepID=A0ABT7A6I4_9ACTN|nr:hypothetical protein [Streptomyces iconiensis]MDJ1136935.1 hypothetical protein [Streptomyces iconiensis]
MEKHSGDSAGDDQEWKPEEPNPDSPAPPGGGEHRDDGGDE